MATLEELMQYKAALMTALYQGQRSVRDSNGEEIVFRSVRELQAALSSVSGEISRTIKNRHNTVYLSTSKGL